MDRDAAIPPSMHSQKRRNKLSKKRTAKHTEKNNAQEMNEASCADGVRMDKKMKKKRPGTEVDEMEVSEKKKRMKNDGGEPGTVAEAKESESASKNKKKKSKRAREGDGKDANIGVMSAQDAGDSKIHASDDVSAKQGFDESAVARQNVQRQVPELHLGVFNQLSSVDAAVREDAAIKLVRELLEVQRTYEEIGKDGEDESPLRMDAAKDDCLSQCSPTVGYAIRRLIRGVSSSRACARQGFALGFAAVIRAIMAIDMKSLIKLIDESLETTSSMKGQEARESLLGRLFAYGAIVKSGRLIEEQVGSEAIADVCQGLLSLAEKKSFLRESAIYILLDLVEKVPGNRVSSTIMGVPLLKDWLDRGPESGNADTLLLSLKLYEKYPAELKNVCRMLPKTGNTGDIFTAEHMSYLVPALKESSFCHPRVHSVWQVLVDILFADRGVVNDDTPPAHSSKRRKRSKKPNTSEKNLAKKLYSLWQIGVERSLLPSSHDRKHLAMNIFRMILPRIPASCIEIILSDMFVQCMQDTLSAKDNRLFKMAQHCLEELQNTTDDSDNRRVAVIIALQQKSNGSFDNITKTQTVRNMMKKINSKSGYFLLVQNLNALFLDAACQNDKLISEDTIFETVGKSSNSDEPVSEANESLSEVIKSSDDNLRPWIIDSLYHVLKINNLDPTKEEINNLDFASRVALHIEVLKFLALQGLFTASLSTEVTSFELQQKLKWPKQPASVAVRRFCIEKMQQILADAQNFLNSPKHLEYNVETDNMSSFESNDLAAYAIRFIGTLQNIPSVSLFWSLNNDEGSIFNKLQDAEERLFEVLFSCDKGDANYSKIQAMRYLLVQLLLQIPTRAAEVSEVASELLICCNKSFVNVLEEIAPCSEDSDEPAFMDVLVDALLSLLPHSPGPVRSAVEQVFRCFCKSVTESGIMSMLRIITKDLQPVRRKHVILEESDEEDLIDIEEASSGDELDESEEDGGSTDDNPERQGKRIFADKDEEDNQSVNSDLDDDAMFRMDEHLVKILQNKKSGGGGTDAQIQLKNFKLRVLSLLEQFLIRNSSSPLVVIAFSHLIQAYVNSSSNGGNKQLTDKIQSLVQRRICKGKSYPKGDGVQLNVLEDVLEKILKLSCRLKNLTTNSLGQDCVCWLLKVMHGNFDESELNKARELLSSAIEDFFVSRKCRLKASFIKEVLKRNHWIGVPIFGMLINRCQAARSEFLQRQTSRSGYLQYEALSLMDEILKPLQVSSEADRLNHLKLLKDHLPSLSELIQSFLQKPSTNRDHRKVVKQLCEKLQKAISVFKLEKSFAKLLKSDGFTSFQSKSVSCK